MKTQSLLFLILLFPAVAFCQSVNFPSVGSAEDALTTITKIEVNSKNTIITFKHTSPKKGDWMELNKSMYLQDANGEAQYKYIASEGIPLRPLKHYATADNEEMTFKVYFQKLKPGTKQINVIERARSAEDLSNGTIYDNFYNVSLLKSAPRVTNVRLIKPISDTVRSMTSAINAASPFNDAMASMGPMMSNMYTNMLNAQLKVFSDPATIDQLAKITKNHYDALIKVGFTADQALKIITSKQLISTDINGKQ